MNPFFNGPEQASIMDTGVNTARRRWSVVLNASALLENALDRFYPDSAPRLDTQAEISARAIRSSVPLETPPAPDFAGALESAAAEGNAVGLQTDTPSEDAPLDADAIRRQIEYATRHN